MGNTWVAGCWTCGKYSQKIPHVLALLLYFNFLLVFTAHSKPVVIFHRPVWTTNSPLVRPLSRSHSKLGAWEDVLQRAKGSCTAAHVLWCQHYCSRSLSSWSAVTRHQGNYSLSYHSRDKIRKNRYSRWCSEWLNHNRCSEITLFFFFLSFHRVAFYSIFLTAGVNQGVFWSWMLGKASAAWPTSLLTPSTGETNSTSASTTHQLFIRPRFA